MRGIHPTNQQRRFWCSVHLYLLDDALGAEQGLDILDLTSIQTLTETSIPTLADVFTGSPMSTGTLAF